MKNSLYFSYSLETNRNVWTWKILILFHQSAFLSEMWWNFSLHDVKFATHKFTVLMFSQSKQIKTYKAAWICNVWLWNNTLVTWNSNNFKSAFEAKLMCQIENAHDVTNFVNLKARPSRDWIFTRKLIKLKSQVFMC